MERNYILFDSPVRDLLYPFTHTRPIAACRVGILTIQEKWEHWLGTGVSHFTVPHLQDKFPLHRADGNTINILLNGHILPDAGLIAAIAALQPDEELYKDNHLLAKTFVGQEVHLLAPADRKNYPGEVVGIFMPWDIFALNDKAIRADFTLLTEGKTSAPISSTNQLINATDIFLEPGATVECSILNATTGPIYIGKNAQIMEGCLIRGAFAMGEGAVLKMGTKIYGATTLGPFCTGGGEIKNSVLFGYSNKGHDGYLGDAVVGEWCNLGANTSCSNLKNNVSQVKVWVEAKGEAVPAGLKCGVLMGDHSRCGINTMLNTGTVIGVSCNVFGGHFPAKFNPSFSWGGEDTERTYRLPEALRDAGSWMALKGRELQEADRNILEAVYELVNFKDLKT
ncbi:UDP-N-acetylglucosamine diphosphorylase/glucosamine-1-phosphate N-acetyltransferase [Chitinophaga niastensis]|uniref:UDP-N-acetylglucosamine diphosphorylase/glucosamine-1-phosphate N-acetyltransferase n=1 Tax=Chitinophaga niastensis TaxID=536980 RepID=A0A2P8HPI6_CHINA|nr:putative sugar nucleotidyl transferase [Chitinophaga niastensis]PSL48136.1 UDP-N-acetylglucosamine diphosphorylase/glucosamine-1-phosphate N-acetyltransferase [Chitinophaga niastensis]